MAGTFATHVIVGALAQFFVDQRDQPLQGRLISFAPGQEQLRDSFIGGRRHRTTSQD